MVSRHMAWRHGAGFGLWESGPGSGDEPAGGVRGVVAPERLWRGWQDLNGTYRISCLDRSDSDASAHPGTRQM